MAKLSKVFNILGVVACAAAMVTIMAVIIYDFTQKLNYLEITVRYKLYSAGIDILVVGILSTISLLTKSKSKGLQIAGIVLCFFGLYQTYGVPLLALLGFVFTLVDISNQEKEREKEIEALPETERVFVQNNDINFRYKHVDYKSYVKKQLPSYIISIVLSTIYLGLYIVGVIFFIMFLFEKWDLSKAGLAIGLAIFFYLFVLLIYFFVALIIFIWLLWGLLVSILAITAPGRKILKLNSVLGFLCLTFFNAIASIDILNEIDNNIKQSIR